MRVPRIVFHTLQDPQPFTNSERDLADHDAKYLLRFLEESNNETYSLEARPEERGRNTSPLTTCFVRPGPGGRSLSSTHC